MIQIKTFPPTVPHAHAHRVISRVIFSLKFYLFGGKERTKIGLNVRDQSLEEIKELSCLSSKT